MNGMMRSEHEIRSQIALLRLLDGSPEKAVKIKCLEWVLNGPTERQQLEVELTKEVSA
jgi:hypothetical protein